MSVLVCASLNNTPRLAQVLEWLRDALFEAVRDGNVSRLRSILSHGLGANLRDASGRTPLGSLPLGPP